VRIDDPQRESSDIVRLNNDDASALWESASEMVEGWFLVSTSVNATAGVEPGVDSFKAFFDVDHTSIAIWSDGYWFVREGRPTDANDSLRPVGEAPVEIYCHYGFGLYEAELLGPYVELAPGESTEFTERWQMIPAETLDLSLLPE